MADRDAGVDEAEHWLYECRGVNGVADKLRSRHREIVQNHLGIDILDEEIRWWLTPLAAGHVHPGCWKYCSYLRLVMLLIMCAAYANICLAPGWGL